jgi:hypothetical protein
MIQKGCKSNKFIFRLVYLRSACYGEKSWTEKTTTVQSIRDSQAQQGSAGLSNGDFNVLALQRLHDLLRHILIRDHLMNRGRRDDT